MKQSQKPSSSHKPHVVVIGGGTGTFVVLSGLKNEHVDLTAIVTVADSGGSTGRLRDEFGFQPVGDLRQSLAALAKDNGDSWIRDLLLYRFKGDKELGGHNLGNLILTALQDLAGGSTPRALEIAGKIFRLDGHIYPSTLENVQLEVTYADGTTILGEHHLDDKTYGGKKITTITLKPSAKIYDKAAEAIKQANLIVIGPGDLYASILPHMIVEGASESFQQTSAKVAFIINLMTRYTQTPDMTAKEHVDTLSHYMGRKPDVVVLNTGSIPADILHTYEQEHEYPVKDDLKGESYQVIRGDFVSTTSTQQKAADVVKRSLLRHDQTKLTQAIMRLI